jgi:hypothetical protein
MGQSEVAMVEEARWEDQADVTVTMIVAAVTGTVRTIAIVSGRGVVTGKTATAQNDVAEAGLGPQDVIGEVAEEEVVRATRRFQPFLEVVCVWMGRSARQISHCLVGTERTSPKSKW